MRVEQGSTRDTALSYDGEAMRLHTFLLPVLLLLADGVACKDDEPTGGEFGDPCGYDPETDKEMNCASGLMCRIGYCEDSCSADSDCRPVEGFAHTCYAGVCRIECDAQANECPQEFETPLECVLEACVSAL